MHKKWNVWSEKAMQQLSRKRTFAYAYSPVILGFMRAASIELALPGVVTVLATASLHTVSVGER